MLSRPMPHWPTCIISQMTKAAADTATELSESVSFVNPLQPTTWICLQDKLKELDKRYSQDSHGKTNQTRANRYSADTLLKEVPRPTHGWELVEAVCTEDCPVKGSGITKSAKHYSLQPLKTATKDLERTVKRAGEVALQASRISEESFHQSDCPWQSFLHSLKTANTLTDAFNAKYPISVDDGTRNLPQYFADLEEVACARRALTRSRVPGETNEQFLRSNNRSERPLGAIMTMSSENPFLDSLMDPFCTCHSTNGCCQADKIQLQRYELRGLPERYLSSGEKMGESTNGVYALLHCCRSDRSVRC